MTTHRERFPFEVGENPEPLPQVQHDLDTATMWTLHMAVKPDTVAGTAVAVLGLPSERLTGYALGGDSWAQWAEPWPSLSEDEDMALHVYFVSRGDDALDTAREFVAAAGVLDWTVSTAGDWAMQLT